MIQNNYLHIRVMPGARKNFLKKEEGRLKIYLQAPALEGKANQALVEFLAEYLNVKKSQIEIIKGLKSRNKIVNIKGV